MIRLFVAIPLPETVRDALAALAGGLPGARWVPSENLHLTLRFVGEVDEGRGEDLHDALAEIRAPAFDLTIAGVGLFGDRRRAKVLWAGLDPVPEALTLLQHRVDGAAGRTVGLGDGRKFAPHITLARLDRPPHGRLQRWLDDHALLRLPPFRVDAFALFSSLLRPEGPIYREEARYPLET